MESIVKNQRKYRLTVSAYSLTNAGSEVKPENALEDNDETRFQSLNSPSDQWWQASFSSRVSIFSYLMRTSNTSEYRPTDWIINTSNDNKTWITVDTRSNEDISERTIPFNLSCPVTQGHFF